MFIHIPFCLCVPFVCCSSMLLQHKHAFCFSPTPVLGQGELLPREHYIAVHCSSIENPRLPQMLMETATQTPPVRYNIFHALLIPLFVHSAFIMGYSLKGENYLIQQLISLFPVVEIN